MKFNKAIIKKDALFYKNFFNIIILSILIFKSILMRQ